MPVMEKSTTYTPLPPPPLPQFYSSKARREWESSTLNKTSESTAAREMLVNKEVTGVDGAYDIKPRDSKLGPSPSMPLIAMPTTNANTHEVPPLAIYHICRICLRPRSPRYHREHPIPLEGVPPPPGICRRCRVTKVIDTKTMDLVYEDRSNEVKLGFFTPFMRDEDIVSQEEMKNMKIDELLRGRTASRVAIERTDRHRKKSFCHIRSRSGRRSDGRKDVRYQVRYAKVDDQSQEESSGVGPEVESAADIERRKVTFRSSQEAIEAFNSTPPASHTKRTVQTSMQVEPTVPDPLPCQPVDGNSTRQERSFKATVSTKSSSHASQKGSQSTARASARVTVPPAGPTASEVGRIVRDELDRYAEAFKKTQWAESDIRKISKEEVERYRAAERKIEAHRDPFAHGRLVPIVPVERRIEIERDAPAATPWNQSIKDGNTRSGTSDRDWQKTKVTVTAQSKTSGHNRTENLSAARPSVKSRDSKSQTERPSGREEATDDARDPPASYDFSQVKVASTKESGKLNPSGYSDHGSMYVSQDEDPGEETGWEDRQSRSRYESRGSCWRREVSVERRHFNRSKEEAIPGPEKEQAAEDTSKRAAREASSDPPSVKLREVYDDVPESDPPRWSSKAEPYVVASTPTSRLDKHNVIEVIEEVDLPLRPRSVSYRRPQREGDARSESKSQRHSGYGREVDVRYVRVNDGGHPYRDSRPNDDETWSSGTSLGDRGTRATLHTVRSRALKKDAPRHKNGSTRPLDHKMSGALPVPAESNAVQDRRSEYQPDMTRWAGDDDYHRKDAAEKSSRTSRSQTRDALDYAAEDDVPTSNPSAREKRRSRAASRRSERHCNSDVEYIYTERIVTPADCPRGWRPSKLKVIEEEEMHLRDSPSRGPSPQ